jgi:DNA-binding HxlR family transcriptional regulator
MLRPSIEKAAREMVERNSRVYKALEKLGRASFGELRKEADMVSPRLSRCLSDFERWGTTRKVAIKGRKRFVYELTGEPLPPVVTYDHETSSEIEYDKHRGLAVTTHRGRFRPRVWKAPVASA